MSKATIVIIISPAANNAAKEKFANARVLNNMAWMENRTSVVSLAG
jgi:hypothetical protein